MGYSARRGFTNGKISGAARQAEMQQKIAEMQAAMTSAQENLKNLLKFGSQFDNIEIK